jgi:hypothetical protein
MLVMVIAIAGLAFGQQAAEGALFGELADLIGPESAVALQAMLRSAALGPGSLRARSGSAQISASLPIDKAGLDGLPAICP